MKSNSPIHSFFWTHKLPLTHGKQEFQDFLINYYKQFEVDISKLIIQKDNEKLYPKIIFDELEKRQDQIHSLCEIIKLSLNDYLNGMIVNSYQRLYQLLDSMENDFLYCGFGRDIFHPGIISDTYRIRKVKSQDQLDDPSQLFHIPFNNVSKISAYRYSISGFPCLYLATDKALCWYECGKPKYFYHSTFKKTEINEIILLDFRHPPHTFIGIYSPHKTTDIELLTNSIMRYITTLPLLIACSISVSGKNNKFSPEYIFPQILLSWIRKKESNIGGVAYFSCAKNREARLVNSYNIVLATERIGDSKYCKKLLREFEVSVPEHVDIEKYCKTNNYSKNTAVFALPDGIDFTKKIN